LAGDDTAFEQADRVEALSSWRFRSQADEREFVNDKCRRFLYYIADISKDGEQAMAQVTVGTDAYSTGTRFLEDIVETLIMADQVGTINDTIAYSNTQPQEDGVDQDITYHGSGFQSESGGIVTSLDYYVDFEKGMLGLTGLSITLNAVKTAVADATPENFSGVLNLFRGIGWNLSTPTMAKRCEIFGSGGDDTFVLGTASDIYMLDGGTDDVDTGDGNDRIYASNFYGYSALGTATVDAGAGTDTLFLTYRDGGEKNFFDVGQKVDLDGVSVFNGGSVTFSNLENISGSTFADQIIGNDNANSLDGRGGNDKLIGSGGKDKLTGSNGDDRFSYLLQSDSRVGDERDIITDFTHGRDRIDLTKLHPGTADDKFVFIGEAKFHNRDGELHFKIHDEAGAKNDFMLVEADFNGNGKADIQIELTGIVDLTKGDFIL
jgi:Ca2+-binding RTX toxin-like protein